MYIFVLLILCTSRWIHVEATHLAPIVMIPGLAGSVFEAKLDGADGMSAAMLSPTRYARCHAYVFVRIHTHIQRRIFGVKKQRTIIL